MDTFRATTFCLFLTTAFLLTGCFETLNGPYDGKDKIAFAFDLVAEAEQDNEPAGRTVRGDTTQVIQLPTELIGPQRSESVEVNFDILEEEVIYEREVPTDTGGTRTTSYTLAEPTTADEGVHYEFPQDGSFTLPADSSSANLQVRILDSLNPGDSPVRVTVRLNGNESANLLPAERLRYYALTLMPPS